MDNALLNSKSPSVVTTPATANNPATPRPGPVGFSLPSPSPSQRYSQPARSSQHRDVMDDTNPSSSRHGSREMSSPFGVRGSTRHRRRRYKRRKRSRPRHTIDYSSDSTYSSGTDDLRTREEQPESPSGRSKRVFYPTHGTLTNLSDSVHQDRDVTVSPHRRSGWVVSSKELITE